MAYGWAMPRMEAGDEIILSVMEHHANIVPWHFLRERQGVVLKWIDTEADGSLDPAEGSGCDHAQDQADCDHPMFKCSGHRGGCKIDLCRRAGPGGSCACRWFAGFAVHMPVDVQDIGCDFYAVTGHKLYGPSGSGAIYIHPDRMAEMQPFIGGGDMIKEVSKTNVVYNDPPMKFEAGTPGIVQTIGFGVALEYMMSVGMAEIAAHEAELRDYALSRFKSLNWMNVQGQAPGKAAIFSFTLEGAAHAHDISTILDKKGVAVRAGHHCAGPLMDHLGVSATCRASFGMYNTKTEVDVLVDALELAHELFG